jgi:hypothetical protein
MEQGWAAGLMNWRKRKSPEIANKSIVRRERIIICKTVGTIFANVMKGLEEFTAERGIDRD